MAVFNRSCRHGNCGNLKFYLSIKVFHQYIFQLPSSACELQPFSCHDLANDIFSQTVKTVFSHLKVPNGSQRRRRILTSVSNVCEAAPISLVWFPNGLNELPEVRFQFLFILIGKSTMAFLTGQSWSVPILGRR